MYALFMITSSKLSVHGVSRNLRLACGLSIVYTRNTGRSGHGYFAAPRCPAGDESPLAKPNVRLET
jgi:hypothetical protein